MAYIGIVVPVYKIKEAYLRQCIESLQNQTFQDIQIILVDDCSPDHCGEICEAYAAGDQRITTIHHPQNRGLPAARNSGTAALDSDWVCYVDGDDWVEENMCQVLYEYLQSQLKRPEVIIFSGYRNYPDLQVESPPVFQHGERFDSYPGICELQYKSMEYTNKSYPSQALNLDSACWKLISMDYLRRKNISFIEIPYREDGLYFLYLTEQAGDIVYLHRHFYHYRSTGNSMVNAYRDNADEEHLIYLREVWKFAHRFSKARVWTDRLYYQVFLSMQICITQKFFHHSNPDSFSTRQRACREYFSQKPYCEVFNHIELRKLRRNHMLKAICIKYHCYAGVMLLRDVYLKLRRQTVYK